MAQRNQKVPLFLVVKVLRTVQEWSGGCDYGGRSQDWLVRFPPGQTLASALFWGARFETGMEERIRGLFAGFELWSQAEGSSGLPGWAIWQGKKRQALCYLDARTNDNRDDLPSDPDPSMRVDHCHKDKRGSQSCQLQVLCKSWSLLGCARSRSV